MQYDCIIAGGGIAGLTVALELIQRVPRLRVAVLEKYGTLGGRVSTYRHTLKDVGALQWEAGAGRISKRHTMVLDLLKRYGLTWVPIGGEIRYKADGASDFQANAFEPAIPVFLDTIAGLPADQLATHTIRQLLTKVHGPAKTDAYLLRFPYRAEVDIMRADRALELFRVEMRQHSGYGVCKEGLSELIARMGAEAEKKGVEVLTHHEVVGVRGGGPDGIEVSVRVGSPKDGVGREERLLQCREAVLALPATAAAEVRGIEGWSGWRRLKMTPLLRYYAVFPKEEDGKVWWESLGGRVVTGGPLRYIIPGMADTGSIQISYTDSQDAEYWMEKLRRSGERDVGEEMLGELRTLLAPAIPAPIFTRAHPWKEGVTYWLPGRYSPEALSREAWTPFPDRLPRVHLCGESYSLRQGWMEGAVEHAHGLVEKIVRRFRNG